jgi:hypothetical protein
MIEVRKPRFRAVRHGTIPVVAQRSLDDNERHSLPHVKWTDLPDQIDNELGHDHILWSPDIVPKTVRYKHGFARSGCRGEDEKVGNTDNWNS